MNRLPPIQPTLAITVTIAFAGLVTLWMLHPPQGDEATRTLANSLVMMVGTGWLTIMGFYFGSSASSRDKDETISKIATKNGSPAPTSSL